MENTRDYDHFLSCVQELRRERNASDIQIFADAEKALNQQAKFVKQQHALIDETVRDFRLILCRINIFEFVAKMFSNPEAATTVPDVEQSRLESLNQPLISREILETT